MAFICVQVEYSIFSHVSRHLIILIGNYKTKAFHLLCIWRIQGSACTFATKPTHIYVYMASGIHMDVCVYTHECVEFHTIRIGVTKCCVDKQSIELTPIFMFYVYISWISSILIHAIISLMVQHLLTLCVLHSLSTSLLSLDVSSAFLYMKS